MEQEKKYRHELKYMISYPDYVAMRERLKAVMKSDPHTMADGTYLIRSIYFDNSDDKALKEKIDGNAKREKFRVRWYNDDFSFITIEKKIKVGSLCQKYDAVITEDELKLLLGGKTQWMRSHPEPLVKELYAKMCYERLRPKVAVSYRREPYVYSAGNVRVTFDSRIRTSLFTKDFLTENLTDISATDTPTDMILEVKYDAFIPEVVQHIIQVNFIRQQAFSKYCASRRYG